MVIQKSSLSYNTCKALIFIIVASFFINNPSYSQDNWDQLFYDDFEAGNADKWELTLEADEARWDIIDESSNFVLSGYEWNSAAPILTNPYPWSNYSFSCKVKLIGGFIGLGFRNSPKGVYNLFFDVSGFALRSSHNLPVERDTILIDYSEDFEYDVWYSLKIVVEGNNVKIYIDDVLKIDIDDPDPDPLLYGSILIETNPGSTAYFDDFMVTGETLDYDPHPEVEFDPFISALPGYTWLKTGGPNGGLGYDIRIHPEDKNIMFVTDNPSGVNKSIDEGVSWQQKNTGIDAPSINYGKGAPIFALTIDPSNPSIVWAGSQNLKGIYKSSDYGETWETKINGINEGNEISFRGFAIHPHDSNIVLASGDLPGDTHELLGQLSKGFIYKTTDGGENWYKVWAGENLSRVLIFDYNNPDILYCSTGIFDFSPNNADPENLDPGGVGVLKSIDGGENWFKINNGLENLSIGFFEMHPTNPDILYAAAGDGFSNNELYDYKGAIYKTVDGGEHWETSLQGGHFFFSVVTISKSNPNIVYAGYDGEFYKSDDGGDNWSQLLKPDQITWGPPGIWGGVPISAAVDPDDPDVIFVNSYSGGNYKSVDGAKTWINSSKGYSGASVHDVIVDPNDPSQVYSAAFSGPFYSTDGGDNWEGMLYGAPIATPVKIAINPQNSNELLMSGSGGSIFRSANNGLFWETVFVCPDVDQLGNENYRFKAISYAPSDPTIIYAGIRRIENNSSFEPIAMPSFGMYKSIDGGENWAEINNGLENTLKNINCVAVHPTDSEVAYTATGFDGIYKSEDGGDSWVRKSNGLTSTSIMSLAIDKNDPDIIYAGSADGRGIFKSVDGGELWLDFNNNIQLTCPSYLSPIGKSPEGISFEKSKSVSKAYELFADIPWTRIFDIEIDPSNSDNVYVVDDHSGIYVSNDAGASWWIINEGLNVLNPTSISISSDGEILYAGTASGGVFRLVLGGNKEPIIKSTAPISIDTINAELGDTLLFEVNAFDFNQDTLNYTWYLNDVQISNSILSKYLLETDDLIPAFFNLKVEVSDKDTSVLSNWVIKINIRTSELITICQGEEYRGWTEAGEYERILTTDHGTDSIVITNLSLYPSFVSDFIVREDTLISIGTYQSYQWYDEDGEIAGATDSEYIISKSGSYYLVVIDENGCSNTSNPKLVLFSGVFSNSIDNFKYSIIPNPNKGIFSFRIESNPTRNLTLKLVNGVGQTIEVRSVELTAINHTEQFDVSNLSKGIYHLVISSDNFQNSEKIVVE